MNRIRKLPKKAKASDRRSRHLPPSHPRYNSSLLFSSSISNDRKDFSQLLSPCQMTLMIPFDEGVPLLSPLYTYPPLFAAFTDHWPLITDYCSFGRSGLFGPPLCGGSAPATPPLLQPPPHRVCGNMTLTTRCDRASPPSPHLAGFDYVPAQARQARQFLDMPKVHRKDHRESPTEIRTLLSAQADRTQRTQIMA